MDRREKILSDKEIELYEQSEMLRIDKELVSRERGNWESINEAREKRRNAEVAESEVIARLQAKKEALGEVLTIKDKEISLLKDLLEKAISAIQTIKTAA